MAAREIPRVRGPAKPDLRCRTGGAGRVVYARDGDERLEVTDHVLRLRALINQGAVGIDFKPAVVQPLIQPPRWLAMMRAADSANRLGNVSFSFYRSDDAPTSHDL